MPNNTIDTLELEIKSNSQSAAKSLDELSKKLYSLSRAFGFANNGGLKNYSQGIENITQSLSELSKVNLNGNGVNKTLNAIKRLSTAKIGAFTPVKIAMIGNSLKSLSKVSDVSPTLNRFVSSFSRLANAGEKTSKSASGIANLGRQLRKTITNLSGVGEISDSLNLFVQSVGRLATAGGKAGETASGLKSLSIETRSFFDVMKDAPKVSENTIRMTEALAQLATAGGKVGESTNTINKAILGISKSTGIAKSSFNVLVKTAKFNANQIVKLSGKISSAFKNIISSSRGLNKASLNLGTILKTAIGFRLGYGLLNFGKSAIDFGSDITEVQNVVDVAFGSMSGMVEEFANTSIENFGLSKTAAKEYSGILMSMFKSSGFNSSETRQQAAEMSIALTGLAGDLASFYNIRTEDAFYKLRAAMAGEIEPMRQLGVNMNIANLEAYALANGINKSYQSMSQAEQQLLRYNYLMAVTGAQQGDFARTSGSWANQTRILAENFRYLSAVIGQGLIAAVLPGIRALNALMGKLVQVAEAFRNFIYTLMGKKVEGSQGGIVNDLAGIGDTSSGLENLGIAGGDAASGMEDATGAAQDLKKSISVLSFDQLNQLSNSASAAGDAIGGIGGGGNLDNIQVPTFGGLADALDQFKNPDTGPISDWAKRIRDAFLNNDWEGLGLIVAGGLNKGLWHVYDAISWKNVGPKITAFTNAFTKAFNSLVTGFDWNRLGRVVGAGINTLVNTFNSLIGPFGIDFENIGKKLSVGLKGAIDEIEWTNLGSLLGNGFMISWRMLDGFITDMSKKDGAGINGWNQLGASVGDALKAAFHRIDFDTIANVFSNGFNGIFDVLEGFNASKPFEGLGDKISTALNNAISNIDAQEAGRTLNTFVQSILDTLLTAAEKTNWEEFGNKVGTFLSQIEWGEILRKAFSIVKEVLGGIWSGLGDTSAGKFIQGVVIFKLGTKLMPFVNNMVSFFTGSSVTQKLSGAFQTLFNGGLSGATGAIKGLGNAAKTAASGGFKSLLSAIGSSGAGIGLIAVLPVATSMLAGFVEKLMGGNGKLSTMGASINDLAGKLQQLGTLSKDQAEEVWSLVDAWENEGLSAQEMATKLMEKFSEWGLSTDAVNAVLQDNNYWTSQVKDNVDLLTESAGQLGEGFSNTAEQIDLSSVSIKEAMGGFRDVLWDLKLKGDEFSGTYQGILMSMDDTLASSATAQEALNMLVGQLEAAGVPTDQFITMLQQRFPEATLAVKTSVDTNIVGMQQTVTTEMGKADKAVDESTYSMKKNAEKNLSSVKKSAEQSAHGVSDTTILNWGKSAREVTVNLRAMKLAASTELSNMTETVRSFSESMYNIMTKKWEYLRDRILALAKEISDNISESFASILDNIKINLDSIDSEFFELSYHLQDFVNDMENILGLNFSRVLSNMVNEAQWCSNQVSNVFSNIPHMISGSLNYNMYYTGRSAAQSFANGISSVHIPMPHIKVDSNTWRSRNGYSYRMSSRVDWYKTGGLFNVPSVIGVGEAGKEAVLPLENKRTMSMIADSIMARAPQGRLDYETIENAVAKGVAIAMINNQSSQNFPQYLQNDIYIDGDVLARTVSKAQKERDSRFNPTLQFV